MIASYIETEIYSKQNGAAGALPTVSNAPQATDVYDEDIPL